MRGFYFLDPSGGLGGSSKFSDVEQIYDAH